MPSVEYGPTALVYSEETEELEHPATGRDVLAQTAVDTGLASDTQTARDEIHEVTV